MGVATILDEYAIRLTELAMSMVVILRPLGFISFMGPS
jgi:hypothetical protein